MEKLLLKTLCTGLLLILFVVGAKATDQFPDIINYQGETYYFSATWDEDFLFYPILQDTQNYHANLPKYSNGRIKLSACSPSACYREYIAEWTIYDNVFYLQAIRDCCTEQPLFDLATIFGEEAVTDKGVKATWVSQSFSITSKPINAFNFLDSYSYIKLSVEQGVVKKFNIEQYPDYITYQEEFYYLHGDLDRDFLLYDIISTPNYHDILKVSDEGLELSHCHLLNCHRDYQASWVIHDSTLYLKSVDNCCNDNSLFDLATIFGKEAVTDKGVKATWVNEYICLSTNSSPQTFTRKDTKYIMIKIEHGMIKEY